LYNIYIQNIDIRGFLYKICKDLNVSATEIIPVSQIKE
jgi:hypothetical protein